MNNLLSRTFSSRSLQGPYLDLERDSRDFEAQAETEMASQNNLTHFFNEVEIIKEDMEKVKKLLSELQKANSESMAITKAHAMKALRDRMDRDVDEVLKKAKVIKGRLEDLDQANLASRRIHGCEQGSSTDRTRMSITNSLRKTLRDLMGEFRALREKMMSEYKETIERRYYTVTGNQADEDVIDHMIDTGESETFLHKAIQEQGKGHIIDTIKEIQERHETVKEIEKNLMELHQIFLDMAVLVEAQGEQLNNIEAAVQGAFSFVKRGTEELQTAKKLQRNTRKCKCIALLILLVIILIFLVPILVKILPSLSKNNSSSSSNNTSSTTPSTATSPPSS